MAQPHPLGPISPFFTSSSLEDMNVLKALRKPLSGYLAGNPKGGYWVERLSTEWASAFSVTHAIPCNSATSGLLAACMAAGIGPGDTVWTSGYSMSATAACAKVLGARIVFIDIETTRYSMNPKTFTSSCPKAIIATNLFGHPAYLTSMRGWCDSNNVILIEDNAQAIFAKENGRYAGTIGHIGVFSLNVHKHLTCGEGGVIVTSDEQLGDRLSGAINHGEMGSSGQIGLNLRLTELCAAVAVAQLDKSKFILEGRIALAEEIASFFDAPYLIPQKPDNGCTHSYYILPIRVLDNRRERILQRLSACNFPMRKGYSPCLNKVFASNQVCEVAERCESEELMTFEVCSYNPTTSQLAQMKEIVKWATDQ